MKKIHIFAASLCALALSLQGCMSNPMQAVSSYNNIRAGYQAYQGLQGMKAAGETRAVLRDTDTMYVVADLKPSSDAATLNRRAAEQICDAFAKEFADIKAHDLNRGRELKCVSQGDVPANAVVMNLRETVEEGRLLRAIQSNTIKSDLSWVSRANGVVLAVQANPAFEEHDELIAHVGKVMTMQLLRSVAPEQSDPDYQAWTQKVEAWGKSRG